MCVLFSGVMVPLGVYAAFRVYWEVFSRVLDPADVRGDDLAGYNYWVGQLNGGLLSREQVRQQFLASAEMQAQSAAIAMGCRP